MDTQNDPDGRTVRVVLWSAHGFLRFSRAIEASVGIFMGQTSMQDSDLEQSFPKWSA